MTGFQEVRDVLFLSFEQGYISEEELLLLLEEYTSKNPGFSYNEYDRFDFDSIQEPECKYEFRIEKNDIPILADILQLPEVFKCSQRTVASKIEGLCMLLKRSAYPCRYNDMIQRFGRPVPEICMITNAVVNCLYEDHGHRITEWNHEVLSPASLETYAAAIHHKGAALQSCFGFLDGTVRPISRPGENQRAVYNGHKRVHSLKFQSMGLPNGLVGNLYGPVEGRRHDAGILADSGLLQNLERYAFSRGGQPMCLYGDPAYPLRVHLQGPFKDARLTPNMLAFNESMSAVRVSVEWIFGDIVNSFKFIDFRKNLKIGLSSVGKLYIVCALLQNAITCLYGNKTSTYFDLQPPTVQEYFA